MTDFSSKILNNSVGALAAQQAVIATTANNIANVNTPGYARRSIDLQTRVTRGSSGTLDIGNGVEIGRVQRITDEYITKLLRTAAGDQSYAGVRNEFLDRAQQLFGLTDTDVTVGTTLGQFFDAADDLAANPSSVELRTSFISKANDLVNSIRTTYEGLASLQGELDQRLANEVQNVNSLTSQIAELNGLIVSREGISGTVAGDERDRRDVLLQSLAEKMNFSVVEEGDGSLSITLPNGFPLVNGTSTRKLETTPAPSFLTGTAPGLDGSGMNFVVFDYAPGATNEHVDLTSQFTGGEIGAILSLRGTHTASNTSPFQATGTIVDLASRIEGLSRSLLTQFNTTYLGPDRDSGTAGHQPSSGDLDGNTPSVFGLFTFAGATDANSDGLPSTSDLTASGITSFSSVLQLTISDPRDVAAARDVSGGAPAAAVYPSGDGANMRSLTALRDSTLTYSVGSFSYSGTVEQLYSDTVSKVGNEKARAEIDLRVASGNLETAQNRRDEVSGVSLDEEFTNLIKFQKAYQAAAKMIRVGQELLDEIIQAI